MICGHDIYFQRADKKLIYLLQEIISINMDHTQKFIVAIPPYFYTYRKYSKKERRFWAIETVKVRRILYKYLSSDQKYGNACFTRMAEKRTDIKTIADFFDLKKSIQEIWKGKKVLIVEGKSAKTGLYNDLFINTNIISRILVPDKEAFEQYEYICNKIISVVSEYEIVLLIVGPTATVLSYELYRAGIQSVDLGQINELYIRTLKAFNITMNPEECISDKQYNEQIIFDLSIGDEQI